MTRETADQSATGQGLKHEDFCSGGYGVRQVIPIADGLTVDKDHHVFAEGSLFIEDVASQSLIRLEDVIENLAHRCPRDLLRGTLDVTLQIRSEGDLRHDDFTVRDDREFDQITSTISR